jgi:hypothetical protein
MFAPLDNIEVKSKIFEKRDSLRSKLDYIPATIDSMKKEDVLKVQTY